MLLRVGVFDAGFWDVTVEYAKNSPCDILCRYTVCNESNDVASIHVLPTLWFRLAHITILLSRLHAEMFVIPTFGCGCFHSFLTALILHLM